MDKIPNLPNIKPELLNLPTVAKLDPVGDPDHPPRILMLYGTAPCHGLISDSLGPKSYLSLPARGLS
jgi:hypothetical protein